MILQREWECGLKSPSTETHTLFSWLILIKSNSSSPPMCYLWSVSKCWWATVWTDSPSPRLSFFYCLRTRVSRWGRTCALRSWHQLWFDAGKEAPEQPKSLLFIIWSRLKVTLRPWTLNLIVELNLKLLQNFCWVCPYLTTTTQHFIDCVYRPHPFERSSNHYNTSDNTLIGRVMSNEQMSLEMETEQHPSVQNNSLWYLL